MMITTNCLHQIIYFSQKKTTKTLNITQAIQDHVTTLNKTIDLIQNKVDAHVLKQRYRQSDQPQLIPRTKELQSLLTKAYDHFEKGIDLTFETLDEIKKPKRKKTISRQMSTNPNPAKQPSKDKQPSKLSLVHVQTSFEKLDSNLTAIRAQQKRTTVNTFLYQTAKMKTYVLNTASFASAASGNSTKHSNKGRHNP